MLVEHKRCRLRSQEQRRVRHNWKSLERLYTMKKSYNWEIRGCMSPWGLINESFKLIRGLNSLATKFCTLNCRKARGFRTSFV